jgi:hypothetical protein
VHKDSVATVQFVINIGDPSIGQHLPRSADRRRRVSAGCCDRSLVGLGVAEPFVGTPGLAQPATGAQAPCSCGAARGSSGRLGTFAPEVPFSCCSDCSAITRIIPEDTFVCAGDHLQPGGEFHGQLHDGAADPVLVKPVRGRLARPVSLAVRMRSSQRTGGGAAAPGQRRCTTSTTVSPPADQTRFAPGLSARHAAAGRRTLIVMAWRLPAAARPAALLQHPTLRPG